MTKLKTKILNIASFGLLGLFAKKQIKKQNLNPEVKIKTTTNFSFDALHLIQALGDNANIKECTSTINTVIFKIVDSNLIDKKALNRFNFKGLLINKHSVNIIFGDNAQTIAQSVNTFISKGNNIPNPKIIDLFQNSADNSIKIENPNEKIEIPVAPVCVENEDEVKKQKEKEAESFVVGDCDA